MYLNASNLLIKKTIWNLFQGAAWFMTVLLYMNDMFPAIDIGFLEEMDIRLKLVFQILSVSYFLYLWYDKIKSSRIKRKQENEKLKGQMLDNEMKSLRLDTAKKN